MAMQRIPGWTTAERPDLPFYLDGEAVAGKAGDTLLTAVLLQRTALRRSELTGAARAGFCLMGACQDCWLLADGVRVRACTTLLAAGMRVTTATSRAADGQ